MSMGKRGQGMLSGKKSKFRPRMNKWNSNIARREVNYVSQLAKYYHSYKMFPYQKPRSTKSIVVY